MDPSTVRKHLDERGDGKPTTPVSSASSGNAESGSRTSVLHDGNISQEYHFSPERARLHGVRGRIPAHQPPEKPKTNTTHEGLLGGRAGSFRSALSPGEIPALWGVMLKHHSPFVFLFLREPSQTYRSRRVVAREGDLNGSASDHLDIDRG